ncbi:MAG: hypothetical protein JWR36_2058 [Glaciihabitans sp.]|nr:hypothetical protein [Glaciihabitans sp.]
MNCAVCGTELPYGAMFCGECGRAVGVRAAQLRHADSDMPIEAAPTAAGARDTVIIDPIELASLVPTLPDEPAIDEVEQDLPPDLVDPLVEDAASLPPERPAAVPFGPRGSEVFTDSEDLEQTLIVPRRDQGDRFVLQFSTGESVTVFGSGLLGRNPTPQPGEYFDQLVVISDPGKSVSKTHLEFGQEAGSFWVSDRYSGNGSIVREPESAARRLTAGKRYRIVRGTRVDIAEQFFIVS